MHNDVFVYRLLPRPYPTDLHSQHVAVLSCCSGDHCLLVVPKRRFVGTGLLVYDLHVFSTETVSWSTKVATVADDVEYSGRIEPGRVFSVGGGLVAWVDIAGTVFCCATGSDEEPD